MIRLATSSIASEAGFDEIGYDRVELAEIINKVVSGMNEQNRIIVRERFLNDRSQSDVAR